MVEGKYLDRVHAIKRRVGQIKVHQLRKSQSNSNERIRKGFEFLHLAQIGEDRERINQDFVNINSIEFRSPSLEVRRKRRKKPRVFTYPKTITTGAKYTDPLYEVSDGSSSGSSSSSCRSSSSEDESEECKTPSDHSNEEKSNLSAIVAKFRDTKMIITERLSSSTRGTAHNA